LLCADSLKALLGSSAADVSSLSVSDFDPSNQYKSVLDAVKSAAGNGEVKVFRVELAGGGGTRSEIWVVGLDEHGKSKRIVGLKALVVET
jgi:predicted DNA-binding transcriptional regulator YafY